MSLFGKILAIFNVFAVIGVVALLAMNVAKQRSWEYAVFRQDLMIMGLPLDDKELDEQLQKAKDKISDKTKQEVFGQVSPPTPVATQEEEVTRVKNQLSQQINGAGDKKKQLYLLARVLAPMAISFEQYQDALAYQTHLRDDNSFKALRMRLDYADKMAQAAVKQPAKGGKPKTYEEAFHEALAQQFTAPLGPLAGAFLAARTANPNGNLDAWLDKSLDDQLQQLNGQFDKTFADAVTGGEAIKSGAPSPRRRSIARLLLNMVDVLPPTGGAPAAPAQPKPDLMNNPAYKRFVFVVGVEAAAEAVNEQAGLFEDIALQAEEESLRQRDRFAVSHRDAVALVRAAKVEVDRHKAELNQEKDETKEHLTTLEKRRRDVTIFNEQLAAARRETAGNLEKLRSLSNALFQERVKLQRNKEDNQKLEKEIRALEQGR
jgi:hypothetical protein